MSSLMMQGSTPETLVRSDARARAAMLREANAHRRVGWLDRQIGRTASMLVERDGRTGHAENFAALTLRTPAQPGRILPVRLIARDGDRMVAESLAA